MLIVVLVTLMLSALGAALVLTTGADALIAEHAVASVEAVYAADAVFERTLAELEMVAAFTEVLNGSRGSAFTDGPSSALRVGAGGVDVRVDDVVTMANCQRLRACSGTELDAVSDDRPWGARNPRWRAFAWGPADVAGGLTAGRGQPYTVVLVADDPSDLDDDPATDGGRAGVSANPGAGVMMVRAEAFGRRGAHRVVEATVARLDLAARARWDAADPATRSEAPPTLAPRLAVLTWRVLR